MCMPALHVCVCKRVNIHASCACLSVCVLLRERGVCVDALYICSPVLVPLSICDSVCLRLCPAVCSGPPSPCSRRCVCVRADCLICGCRAMAGGLHRISFIRLIREEERSDGQWEGETKDMRRERAVVVVGGGLLR